MINPYLSLASYLFLHFTTSEHQDSVSAISSQEKTSKYSALLQLLR